MPWPTTITFAGLIRCTIKGRLHGQVTNNVLWFTHPGELGNPDWPAILLNVATEILACAVTHLLPGLSSDFTLEEVTATRMDTADKMEVTVPAAANSVGALGESLPSTVAAVVSLKTPYSGRKRRGRFYVPGIPEANQSQSAYSGPSLAAVLAFAVCVGGKFRYDTGTEDQDWVIFSRTLGYTPPSTYVANEQSVAPVSMWTQRTVLGTMRSRRVGRGA